MTREASFPFLANLSWLPIRLPPAKCACSERDVPIKWRSALRSRNRRDNESGGWGVNGYFQADPVEAREVTDPDPHNTPQRQANVA